MSAPIPELPDRLTQLLTEAEREAESFSRVCRQNDCRTAPDGQQSSPLAYVRVREEILGCLAGKLREAAVIETTLEAAGILRAAEREALWARKHAIREHVAVGVATDEAFVKMLRSRSGACRKKISELQRRKNEPGAAEIAISRM